MRRQGFSLIEVTMASAILLVVLLSLLSIFEQGNFYFSRNKFKVPGYNIARGFMEQYYDWASLDALDGVTNGTVMNGSYSLPNVALSVFSEKNTTFSSALNITNGTINATLLKRVRVTVTWPGGNFSLVTLKARY